MIKIITSIWYLLKNIFQAGGFISRLLGVLFARASGLFSFIGFVGTAVITLLTGGLRMFYMMWTIISAYTLVEMFRRFLLITFIVAIFGWVIDYIITHIAVFEGKTIAMLFSQMIQSIEALGQWGHFALAFISKIGLFEGISLFLTVMIFTLMARVALSIIFK